MNTVEFLEAVKEKHGLKSDYKLAKFMNWSLSRVSSYRTGRTQMDESACLEVAAALGMNSLVVVAEINAERAKDSAVQTFWREVAKSVRAGTLAATLAGLTIFMGSVTYSPSTLAADRADSAYTVYYVK